MPGYEGTVTTRHPREEVWRYLADLRSVAEWDPSIDEVRLVSGAPGVVGSRYELEVSFLGRRVELPYVSESSDEPREVVFAAETGLVSIRDEATLQDLGADGTAVTWKAELKPKGLLRLASPLLRLAFSRIGRRAERGLAERLEQPVRPEDSQRSAA